LKPGATNMSLLRSRDSHEKKENFCCAIVVAAFMKMIA